MTLRWVYLTLLNIRQWLLKIVPLPKRGEDETRSLPDYLVDPDAVTKDEALWRSGTAPNYSNTRRFWKQTKQMHHAASGLEEMIENLVKNWEIEASFKTDVSEWRTMNNKTYIFSINGGPPQDAEHMSKVGTYNAILTAPNQYYYADESDFGRSHKIFKRMIPTFAWEVLEVYSGPPLAIFKWRHWGEMKNDYVAQDQNGKEIRHTAHGGLLDIQGICVVNLDDCFRIERLEVWMDPLDLFRQLTGKSDGTDSDRLGTEPTKSTSRRSMGGSEGPELQLSVAHSSNADVIIEARGVAERQEEGCPFMPSWG